MYGKYLKILFHETVHKFIHFLVRESIEKRILLTKIIIRYKKLRVLKILSFYENL